MSFDVDKFKKAIFEENVFSVSPISKDNVNEVRSHAKSRKTVSKNGRTWKSFKTNLKGSLRSKVNRAFASSELRETLTGKKKGKITNDSVLNHIYKNLEHVKNASDLVKLKSTLIALRGFGADPEKCKFIQDIIDEKVNVNFDQSMDQEKIARHQSKNVKGSKNKKDFNVANQAMVVNTKKALYDHLRQAQGKNRSAYVSAAELEEIHQTESPPVPLEISYYKKTDIGVGRRTNEDAEFVSTINNEEGNQGLLLGVMDGHGGSDVSTFANERFPQVFAEELSKAEGNVLIAFDEAFKRVQQEIIENKFRDGSTAVISYIDKNTNKVYTATLGDSEAFICRKIDGKWKLIPLSPIRNWSTDADRTNGKDQLLVDSDTMEYISREQAKSNRSKDVRIVSEDNKTNTNLSRSLGDVQFYHDGKGVNQKSKVSVFQLEPGDKMFLACDGITDYVERLEMIDIMQEKDTTPMILAMDLILKAKENMRKSGGGDNASVIVLDIQSSLRS